MDNQLNKLNDKEMTQLKKALEVKRDIISYLNMEVFIDKVRTIINSSLNFEFRSITSKLYIDTRQPIFVLKLKDEKIYNEISKLSNPIDAVNDLLRVEIIQKISTLLTDCINDTASDLFEGITEELKEFVISNIYVIRANIKENNIQLFFFM